MINRGLNKDTPEEDLNGSFKTETENSSNEQQKDTFTVLLLSCLKLENMAALVCLGDEWYGALQSSHDPKATDVKKKPTLVLSVFAPGQEVVQNILNKAGAKQEPGSTSSQMTKQGVNSYSKGCIVWYRENNLVVTFFFELNINYTCFLFFFYFSPMFRKLFEQLRRSMIKCRCFIK